MLLGLIVEPLLAWYDKNARILPWREEPSPYRVWISEIMLQQTRVEAVKPYFERFMRELPDIDALAQVEDDKLMKLWQGLGYYNRARNLKKAARIACEQFGGRLPASYDELCKLPGIGSYTAGAVSSIAFGLPAPAVDGNVLRVLTRILADYSNVSEQRVKREMEQRISEILPRERAGDLNQALMELGATVCLPNGAPKCGSCPLGDLCEANRQGNQMDFPQKKAKRERRREEKTVLLICCDGRIAIQKRPEKGLLAGLYEFPSLEGQQTESEIERCMKEWGFKIKSMQTAGSARHIFTHVEWQMCGFYVMVERENAPFVWVTADALREEYSIPSAFAFYLRQLSLSVK